MKPVSFLIPIFLAYSSCISNNSSSSISTLPKDDIEQNNSSYKITIDCKNLSEDLTHNDELLIMGYEYGITTNLNKPILNKRLILDDDNMVKTFQWNTEINLFHGDIILILIEQDSDTPIEQIDAILRIHSKSIIEAYESRNYTELEKYLGDEDLLGYKIINKNISESIEFSIEGVYKMDRYSYLIKIE